MAGSSYYIWSAVTRETGRYSGGETQGAGRLASVLIPDPPEPAAMLGGLFSLPKPPCPHCGKEHSSASLAETEEEGRIFGRWCDCHYSDLSNNPVNLPVGLSQDHRQELLQRGQLRTAEVHPLPVSKGHAPLEGSRGGSCLLLVSGGSRCSVVRGCLPLGSACNHQLASSVNLGVFMCPSYVKMPVPGLRARPHPT